MNEDDREEVERWKRDLDWTTYDSSNNPNGVVSDEGVLLIWKKVEAFVKDVYSGEAENLAFGNLGKMIDAAEQDLASLNYVEPGSFRIPLIDGKLPRPELLKGMIEDGLDSLKD